ncbi:hypothetical protein B0J13DRAFT_619363 [Dactylonectria estremocensis]|uniref:Uncharacterized protein n=1 Tax=Dactylonectria estremocensis TaxID=1079267 RepID=A0A9P9JAQ2_9HYPO|nr:hypothetical protein B0J13DRAFT_619363 [Dactylonectria estremocensis]
MSTSIIGSIGNLSTAVALSCEDQTISTKSDAPDGHASRSVIVTNLQDSSLDSDMLSMSDTSDNSMFRLPDSEAALTSAIDAVTARRTVRKRDQDDTDETDKADGSSSLPPQKRTKELHLEPNFEVEGHIAQATAPTFTDLEKWFAMWDIVFPGQPRPRSAYMDPDLSGDLSQFREFSNIHGATMLLEELRASGILPLSDEGTALDIHEVPRRGLEMVQQEWLSTSSSTTRSDTASRNSRRTQPTESQTPGTSLEDSEVVPSSQRTVIEGQGYSFLDAQKLRIQPQEMETDAHQGSTRVTMMPILDCVTDEHNVFETNHLIPITSNDENPNKNPEPIVPNYAFNLDPSSITLVMTSFESTKYWEDVLDGYVRGETDT